MDEQINLVKPSFNKNSYQQVINTQYLICIFKS